MHHENFLLNANPLVAYFQKSPREFTKAYIMRYIAEHGIRMVNFLYPAGDGRLKTLNFVITDRAYLLFEGRILFHGTPEELAENEVVRDRYLTHSFVLRRKDFGALAAKRGLTS